MTTHLIRSAKLNLLYGVALIVTALIAFFGELLSTSNYFNNLPDSGLQGLGVLVVVIIGGILAIAFLVIGIYNIVSGVIGKRTSSLKTAKSLTVISLVTKIICTAALAVYCWMMFDLYPEGLVLKASYAVMSLYGIITSVMDIAALKNS